MKFLKIVPNTFINQNRDERELRVVAGIGWDITVMVKEAEENESLSLPFHFVRMTTRPLAPIIKNPAVNRVWTLFSWAHTARKLQPDVISCHDILCLGIGWLSNIGRRRKAQLVYDSHEFEYGRNAQRTKTVRKIICSIERFLIRRCAFSIMVNKTIAEQVAKLHKLEKMPVVVRNIPEYWHLDSDVSAQTRRQLLQDKNLPPDTFLLKYHGMVTTGRGAEMSIRLVARLPKAALLILGNGEPKYLEHLKQLVDSLGVSDKVIFHEAVSRTELWKYTCASDMGICLIENTCMSYYFSLPNKLFEDVQSLVPILGSNFPEIANIVEGYGVGICCDPDNIEQIIDAVERYRNDSNLADEIQAHLLSAKEVLCWEKEQKTLESAYIALSLK